MEPQQNAASLGELFTMLADSHRRRLLVALMHRNPRDEEELGSEDVMGELDDAADAFLRYRLHHVHLPKLADAGFISWNRETDTITRGPRFDEIRPLLELMERHADELPENWP